MDEARRDAVARIKFRMIHFAWDDPNDTVTPVKLEMLARNKKFNKRNTYVYVLVNFNTDTNGDLERIYKIRDMGLLPYVMIYDRANAPKEIKQLQRWVNNPWVFASCDRFDDYNVSVKKTK